MVKVSILMCVYNGESYLKEAIESLLGQTLNDFEFIIVNDGSTDKTSQILSEYAAQDARIVLVHNEKNLGLEKSLNRGLAVAKGEYLARQDVDDVSLPNRLELQTRFLDSHPEVGALGTAVEVINRQGSTIGEDYLPIDHESLQALLLINNFLHHSTLMARRSLMQVLGGYNEDMRYVEDYDLWLRLSRLSRLATLPDILLRRRIDNSGITSTNREKQLKNAFTISLKAVQECLQDKSQNFDEEAYQRFWWATLGFFDKQAYQRCWLNKYGQDALLQSTDIQKLQPFWNLLVNFPNASQVWGLRLRGLAYKLLREQQTVEGLQLLWIVVYQLKTSIHWSTTIRALVKPYVPSLGQQLWKAWKLRQLEN